MIYKKTCEWCGATFTAQKSSTRFCSKLCTDHAYKEKVRQWSVEVITKHEDGEKKMKAMANNFMTLGTLAAYLNVSRTTAWRYVSEGLFPSLKARGRIRVRKEDVDAAFRDAKPYKKSQRDNPEEKKEKTPAALQTTESTSYTTVKEVAEQYGLSPAGTDKILKNSGITVVKHQEKHYYYKSEVEALFRRREAESHPEIREWYTSAEVQEKFGLKATTIYDIVSTYQIPSKRVHRVTYYSKIHFDAARGLREPLVNEWYTVQEAMEKYGQTRDQVYNVLRYNHIERVQDGKYVKFRRSDYDRIMEFNV